MFIHDALSELVVCGETDILAANIRVNTNRMKVLCYRRGSQGILKAVLGDTVVHTLLWSVWFTIKCMRFQ